MKSIWRFYAVGAILCSLLAVLLETLPVVVFDYQGFIAPFLNGFQVFVGLFILAITSVAPLAERSLGPGRMPSTPVRLSTWQIAFSQWWDVSLPVPLLAVLPGLVALVVAVGTGRAPDVVELVPLVMALVLSYGAAITSLGLVLSSWAPQPRAAALNVAAYLLVSFGWFFMVGVLFYSQGPEHLWPGLATGSPWFGIALTTAEVGYRNPFELHGNQPLWAMFWVAAYLSVAALLALIAANRLEKINGTF